ncbi:MAG: hypothetical protein ACRDZ0_09980 [Acidimicrobiales bacterium]
MADHHVLARFEVELQLLGRAQGERLHAADCGARRRRVEVT